MKILTLRTELCVLVSVLEAVLTAVPVSAASDSGKISTYRVTGWQSELVQASPNLKNFYWEPITKRRRILTTDRTGRQAKKAPLPQRIIVFKKVSSAQLSPRRDFRTTDVGSQLRRSETDCALTYRQSAESEVGAAALSVDAKLAQRNVQSKVLDKGLVANQSCLSLDSLNSTAIAHHRKHAYVN